MLSQKKVSNRKKKKIEFLGTLGVPKSGKQKKIDWIPSNFQKPFSEL